MSHDYFYSICIAEIIYYLNVIRNTLEGRRKVYSVYNNDNSSVVDGIAVTLRLPVLSPTRHVYNFGMVSVKDGRDGL